MMHKARRLVLAVAGLGLAAAGRAEAGVRLDFESVPYNHTTYGGPYSEIAPDGFRLIATSGSSLYTLGPTYSDNYTGSKAVYSYRIGAPFATLAKAGGGTFTLNSIDLSEFSASSPPSGSTATFTGYRQGGSSVSATYELDGSFGLETFTFSGFTDLLYVQISQNDYIQLDNIRLDFEVAAVPEPSTLAGALVGVGLSGGAWLRRRRKAA